MFVFILHWLWMLTRREGNLLRGQQRLMALILWYASSFVCCSSAAVL